MTKDNLLLIISILISISAFFFKGAVLVSLLLLAVLFSALSLWFNGKSKAWWIWGGEVFLLFSAAILVFGAKNIVGSGQQFSSKIAVATLRVFVWAQDQCIDLTDHACTLAELAGVKKNEAIKADLLKPEFKKIVTFKTGEASQSGLYYYAIYPLPEDPHHWVAYAWPTHEKNMPTFCINQNEEILIHEKRGGYVGENTPGMDACLGAIEKIRAQEKLLNWDRDRLKAEERKDAVDHPVGFIKALAAQGKDGTLWGRWRGKATRREKSIFEEE
jgi:hypothetical protein